MRRITLLLGGARSGKSSFALELASGAHPRTIVVTAEETDDEMRARIAAHRRERSAGWTTVEAPLDLAGALESHVSEAEVIVIDCLTVWLGNLLHRDPRLDLETPPIADFLDRLARTPTGELIVVANEVGLGIVPANEMARTFRDLAGGLNQRVAQLADRVALLVAAQPLWVKGSGDETGTGPGTD